MTRFSFKALGQDGEVIKGVRDSSDQTALRDILRSEGLTVVRISEEGRNLSYFFRKILNFSGHVPAHDKILFARNLGSMLDAGLPISRALVVIGRQTNTRALKKIVEAINEGVKRGMPLSENLAVFPDVFSPLFVSMVKAGEESGGLGPSLRLIANQLDAVYSLERRIKGALIYPAVILALMLVIGVLMLIYVVPTLSSTFRDLGVDLPATTLLIITVSEFLRDHTILALIATAALASVLTVLFRTDVVKKIMDSVFIRLPMFGVMVRETNSARTARTLSSLLSAGVTVVSAIEITENVVQNHRYKKVLAAARESIKKGDSIAAVFAAEEKLYPPFVSEMIAIGEETGRLGEMLEGVAHYYETEVEQRTKDMSTVIEPLLMVFIGVAVGFFALSMISPMYSLVNTF